MDLLVRNKSLNGHTTATRGCSVPLRDVCNNQMRLRRTNVPVLLTSEAKHIDQKVRGKIVFYASRNVFVP